MRAVWYAVTNVLMLLVFLAYDALAHSQHFTDEENAWMERQLAVDGTKCCDRFDIFFLKDVDWRISAQGYEVKIADVWHEVPQGRMRRLNPDDPSPFGQERALLFYSVYGKETYIWCFTPPVLT